jgi:hypothetical protein
MYFIVVSPIGTKRCLPPFPLIFINPSLKNKSEILRVVNSLTLSPHPYSVSSMALLRSPCGLLKSMALMSWSISSIASVSGSFLPILGLSISARGLVVLYSSKMRSWIYIFCYGINKLLYNIGRDRDRCFMYF